MNSNSPNILNNNTNNDNNTSKIETTPKTKDSNKFILKNFSAKNLVKVTSSTYKYKSCLSIKNQPKQVFSNKNYFKQTKKIPTFLQYNSNNTNDNNPKTCRTSTIDKLDNKFLKTNYFELNNLNSERNSSLKKDNNKVNINKIFNDSLNETTFKENTYNFVPLLEKVKFSTNNYGYVESYAATTNIGNCRNYNEDRVSIIHNISKPKNFDENLIWPKCSFFGIYDGHAGSLCADFLRDNLHKYIINDCNFVTNPEKAILNGFLTAEDIFLKYSLSNKCNAGSCALIIIIIEKKCYVANVGDSRAIMSGNNGEKLYVLSRDHRPTDEKEYKRVIDAGGKIYQTESNIVSKDKSESVLGPLRVKPGKLSVSRTIGDLESKLPQFGGNPDVVIGIPEIKYFELNNYYDFIILGCDGIFERLKNREISNLIWNRIKSNLNNKKLDEKVKFDITNSTSKYKNLHELTGDMAGYLIQEVLKSESSDNLTAVIISLNGLKQFYENESITIINANTAQVYNNKINKNLKGNITINNKNSKINLHSNDANKVDSENKSSIFQKYKNSSNQPNQSLRLLDLNKKNEDKENNKLNVKKKLIDIKNINNENFKINCNLKKQSNYKSNNINTAESSNNIEKINTK